MEGLIPTCFPCAACFPFCDLTFLSTLQAVLANKGNTKPNKVFEKVKKNISILFLRNKGYPMQEIAKKLNERSDTMVWSILTIL